METSGPTSGIAPRPGPAASTASAPWRAGQLLHATVTESGAGRVLLAIGHRQVSAETSLPLEKGQQLTLQVQTTGQQPVLRILSPAADTTLSTAVRFLLPRQGPMTPLLSSLNQLTTAPQAALPGLIQQLIRSLVRQMPTVESAATPRGLKQALQDSGVFLERHLLQLPAPGVNQAALGADLKANLLRLLQLLRDWPAGEHRGASAAAQKPGTGGTPDTATSAVSGPAAAGARAPLQRAVEFGLTPRGPGNTALPQPAPGAGPGPGPAGGTAAAAPPAFPAPSAPPPLRGIAPSAQAPARVSLDLLNRSGLLRTDMLQQTEAALARLQMRQLAAVPRDAERGLLEWLFELPIRRGSELDLWSMRLSRDARGQAQQSVSPPPVWSVQLAFDLPGLGPMQAQVQISGHQVSTQFWVEHAASLPLLRTHLHELRQAFLHVGLEVGELECRPGPMQTGTPARDQPLISEKA